MSARPTAGWRAVLAWLAMAAALAAGPTLGLAQTLGLPGGKDDAPIEIHADQAIEWRRNDNAYVARGNARASQGNVTVRGDMLTAYYRDSASGTQIWRIDADGNVRIEAPDQTATGEKAVYDVDRGILVLTGQAQMETRGERITARDSLEYWDRRNLVVARGGAVAARGDRRLAADALSARFKTDAAGDNKLSRIDAIDNVVISTPGEIVRAREGVYDLNTGIATLHGAVRITRGDNQLNGEYAEVNFNTGISRLLSQGNARVRGYFVPDEGSNATPR